MGLYSPEEILCFMFFSLIVGCGLSYILSRLAPNIPYTVVIFIIGMCLGLGVSFVNFDHLGESVKEWYSIPPHLLLYIFLPPLLFGDSMNINIHHMKRTFPTALLLAGPGSLFGTFLLAACCKGMLPYNWSWNLCYTFGAILCATDPVAIITLLKQAQATPRLTMLVVQEALYNDGAALVLFDLFLDGLKINKVHDFDASGIAIYFIRVIFISPLIGIAIGLGTIICLRIANRRLNTDDVTIQNILTLCCAYMSFYIAQFLLEVSGVLSCCFAGIVVAWLGPPLILEHASMHSVWDALEWTGNTLIFFLAGILIVHGSIQLKCGIIDFACILLIYLLCNLIRVAMVALFCPFLTTYGLSLRFRDTVFLSFVGLRGAVGTVLGLVLLQSSSTGALVIDPVDGYRSFFLIGGVAAMTLLINGTLAKHLLLFLGCVEESSQEIRIIQHYVRIRIHKRVRELLNDLKTELHGYDESLVAEFSKVVAVNSILNDEFSSGKVHLEPSQPSLSVSPQRSPSCPSMPVMRLSLLEAAAKELTEDDSNELDDLRGAVNLDQNPNQAEASPTVDGNGDDDGVVCVDGNGGGSYKQTRVMSVEGEAMFRIMKSTDVSSSGLTNNSFPRETMESSRGDVAAIDESKECQEEATRTAASSPHPRPVRPVISQLEGTCLPIPTSIPTEKSISLTDLNPADIILDVKLLGHIRIAFLEVVRSTYWTFIEEGKLPRDSHAARALMYSIDVALDEYQSSGIRDWNALQSTLQLQHSHDFLRDFIVFVDMSLYQGASLINSLLNYQLTEYHPTYFENCLTQERNEDKVYILTSYLYAHKLAQFKVPHILGEREGVDTYELAVVVKESTVNTDLAKAVLDSMDKNVVSFSLSKQVARVLLHMQQEMVEKFQQEGILRPRDADKLLQETLHRHNQLKSFWLNFK